MAKQKAPEAPAMEIECKECQRKVINLAVHLRTHGMTPKAYREHHGLPPNSPMVAPGHSRKGIKRGANKTGTALVPYDSKGPQLHIIIDLYKNEIAPETVPTIDHMLRKYKIGEVAQATISNAPEFRIWKKPA